MDPAYAASQSIDCSEYWLAYWYHPDYLGNTEFITNLDGMPYQYFLYSPWGESVVNEHSMRGLYDSPYRFNGKEHDPETGNYYYGARYYDPKVSVWLSVDPLAHYYPSQSPYNYVLNNPINLIDPTGMSATTPCETCPDSPEYDRFRESEIDYTYNEGSENEAGVGTVTPTDNPSGEINVTAPAVGGSIDLSTMPEYIGGAGSLEYIDGTGALGIIGSFKKASALFRLFKNWVKKKGVKEVVEGGSKLKIQFGKDADQVNHAFRHTDDLGLDREVVRSAVEKHFKSVSSQIIPGKPFNQVIEVGGQRIQYTAFKLKDGTINIGRIHGAK